MVFSADFKRLFDKWWYVFRYNLTAAQAGITANLLSMFGRSIEALSVLYVWNIGNPSVSVFTYLIIGRIYKGIAENYFWGSMSTDIITGTLNGKLLRPSSLVLTSYIQMIGRRVVRNLLELASFIISGTLAVLLFARIEINPEKIPLLILFIPLTFTINFFLGYIFGSMAFFLKDKREFDSLSLTYSSIHTVLAGFIIPLNLLPGQELITKLPFAWIIHYPMQVYLGEVKGWGIVSAWLGGVAWCIGLYLLAKYIFNKGLKLNEAVGL
ncbi:MAG: hypothetical protein OHK0017_06300 [Patescibacteria group bacterium]